MVIEATYGWYWAVDLLQDLGAMVHLANPNALNWGDRRVKNDVNDATDLADMLRLNRLRGGVDRAAGDCGSCASWCAIERSWSSCAAVLKAQVHAVMAKEGVLPEGVGHVRPSRHASARWARARRTVRASGLGRCGS